MLGNAAARYLTGLARASGQALNSFGVRHPSLPNYIALVSGSTQGITSDCTRCTADAPNLAGQLERAHRSWSAYLEGLPAPCARPHAPAATRRSTTRSPTTTPSRTSPSRCRRRVPLSQLAADVAGRPAARLRARHARPLPRHPRLLRARPATASSRGCARPAPRARPARVPRHHLRRGRLRRGCCGDSHGGRIATVVAGPDVAPARMAAPIDHYGVLATIEDAFGLPRLGAARDPRHGSLAPLFRGGASRTSRARKPTPCAA